VLLELVQLVPQVLLVTKENREQLVLQDKVQQVQQVPLGLQVPQVLPDYKAVQVQLAL
jgi:hypothetical protein